MKTVDWSPDGLQLASGDDKGVIQVIGDIKLVLKRTLIRICLICGLSLRFFLGMLMACSWHIHNDFDRFGISLPAKSRKLWRDMMVLCGPLLLVQMVHNWPQRAAIRP